MEEVRRESDRSGWGRMERQDSQDVLRCHLGLLLLPVNGAVSVARSMRRREREREGDAPARSAGCSSSRRAAAEAGRMEEKAGLA